MSEGTPRYFNDEKSRREMEECETRRMRDYFALGAMQGMMANDSDGTVDRCPMAVATYAYEVA